MTESDVLIFWTGDTDPQASLSMGPSAALTLDQWQIRFHEAMAALLRAQEAVNTQVRLVGSYAEPLDFQ
jgi:hypothetical protein